ncbi:MAG: formylglycine-generating enzyme family protein, partial [Treponema sp.]|nr:formylglycine-generating enzyme family protein [Treponema sp.]
EKEDGSAGVQSVGGTSLTRDIIIRYNCGPGKSPKKPMFAGNAKFALRNGSAWTFWEGDAATYNGSTGRIPFIGVVMIAFLPEDDTEVVAVRITETLIRLPGDSEDLSPSLELQFSPTTINITGSYYQDPVADQFNNKRFIAIPYTPQLPNVSENYSTFFGLRFKIELFDGVNWSDNITGVQEGFQSIRTKYDLVQIHPLRDVTGATVNSTYERGNFSGFGPAASATSTSQVKINNDIVFSNSVTQFLTVGGAHCQMFPAPFTSGYNDTFGSTPINSSRSVTIPNYRLGEIPVTEKLWHDVRDWAVIREYVFVNNGSTIGDNFPVTNISWQDVIVWCNALSEICGLDPVYRDGSNNVIKNANSVLNTYTMPLDWQERNGFRLPVDAEWDYAARGGNITTAQNGTPWNFTYSGSSNPATVANFSGSISQVKGTRTANNLGLFDMSGNVNEWVWDRNGDILTTTPFTGPASGNNRIIRGGHFSTTGNSQRLGDARGNAAITTQNATTGFRVARSGD